MSNPFAPQPNHLAQAMQNALNLHQRGQFDDAEKAYRKLLKTWPDLFDALHLYGMLQFQRGKSDEALKLIRQALKAAPRSADAHSNLGMVLASVKRADEALASFDRALAIDPNNIGALVNRGRALAEMGRIDDGLASLDAALVREPRHIEARINRGNVMLAAGRRDDAVRDYDFVLALQPGHPGAHFNRGKALFELGRPAEAVDAFQRALSANPKNEMAWNARGVAMQELREHAEAIKSFGQALALNGKNADAHFNLALSLLSLGDYPRGFAAYESRWTRTGMPVPRKFRAPLWTGAQPLAGKSILLHAEQGLGDTIQFARYVPKLAEQGADVLLEVQPELVPLMASLSGAAQVTARGGNEPKSDFHAPLGSLPLAFKTEIASVPAPIPYLGAPADRCDKWRGQLGAAAGPRIALAWAGNSKHVNDRNRSIALSALVPLLDAPAQFISVQHDPRPTDAAILASEQRLLHLGGEIKDLADTAAILSLCDLVISVDTSVAHLAGAMGRPLFALIPFAPDWRWTLDGTSPWYPSARLFRQQRTGDWNGVVAQVMAALAERLDKPLL